MRSARNGTISSLGSTVLSRRAPINPLADPIAPPPLPGTPTTECNGLSRHSTSALPTCRRFSAPTPPPLLACANWKRRGGEGNPGKPRRGQQATGLLPRGRSRGAGSPGTNSRMVRARAGGIGRADEHGVTRHVACAMLLWRNRKGRIENLALLNNIYNFERQPHRMILKRAAAGGRAHRAQARTALTSPTAPPG